MSWVGFDVVYRQLALAELLLNAEPRLGILIYESGELGNTLPPYIESKFFLQFLAKELV